MKLFFQNFILKLEDSSIQNSKKCDGGTEAETSYIVKRIAKNYGHTIDYENHYRWGAYTNYVKYKIDSNIPCVWSEVE